MKEQENTVTENRNLSFLRYIPTNDIQTSFLKEIENDKGISKYVSNISNEVRESVNDEKTQVIAFLIKDNAIDEYVGVCTARPALYDYHAASINYAVSEKYRSSDKKYGRRILSYMTDLLFIVNNYAKVDLEIKGDNLPSIKVAVNSGFSIDYELAEKFYNEGYNHVPYSKNNPYYKDYGGDKVKIK